MSIIKILTDVTADDATKLDAVATIVKSARKSYGNIKAEIASPDVSTVNGEMSFEHLLDDSKVAMLTNEAMSLRSYAIEFARNVEGGNINKKLEELIATNPLMCNIESTSDFSYI